MSRYEVTGKTSPVPDVLVDASIGDVIDVDDVTAAALVDVGALKALDSEPEEAVHDEPGPDPEPEPEPVAEPVEPAAVDAGEAGEPVAEQPAEPVSEN